MIRAAEQFETLTKLQDEKDLERKKWFIAAKEHHHQKELREERSNDAADEFAAAVIVATELELQEFTAELDALDEATVKALMKNREILDRLIMQREAMLEDAYLLDDGRRVFKSEDGKTVYDENGELIPPEVITPDEIPDYHPKAEPYLGVRDGIKIHLNVEKQLHDYQEKLDDARDCVASGEMTKQELDDYRKDLQRNMPIEVRKELPDYDASNKHMLKSNFEASSNPPVLQATDMQIGSAFVPGA